MVGATPGHGWAVLFTFGSLFTWGIGHGVLTYLEGGRLRSVTSVGEALDGAVAVVGVLEGEVKPLLTEVAVDIADSVASSCSDDETVAKSSPSPSSPRANDLKNEDKSCKTKKSDASVYHHTSKSNRIALRSVGVTQLCVSMCTVYHLASYWNKLPWSLTWSRHWSRPEVTAIGHDAFINQWIAVGCMLGQFLLVSPLAMAAR